MSEYLQLQERTWYGWQMLPGYGNGYQPYYSPIFVQQVKPLKTGKGLLELKFFNAFYAEGVQGFELRMKVQDRHLEYLIAQLDYPDEHRNAIISTISFDWVREMLPTLWYHRPPAHFDGLASSECQYYLSQAFFGRLRP
ncbi:hypothetical protein E4634_16010 [Mangrovimicrobium sediminis]|uniref:Uncharacterized protein n=2 Tax=Mangrovimicrobium sediminis TaxID=2562682 RepID=A0A4Z0LY20_9GAMM|nr:hypothetical protein E4634_16010 [Haliea sp. SAOS-164]